MFYKVLLEGMVIDVLENPAFVKYQERNGLILRSKETDAFGVLSSDSSTIWHVEGLLEPPAGTDFKKVELVEIEAEEAEALRKQLEEDGPVVNPEEPDTEEEPTPEPPEEQVMTPVEMRAKITELTANVEALTEQNAMLEECLLEMSALVYA